MVEMPAEGDAPLPAHEAVSPVEELRRMENLINEPLKAGSSYFLVNQRWYKEWLQWVGAPSVQSPQMRPADPPLDGDDLPLLGPISASQDSSTTQRRTRQRTGSWTKDRPGQIDNSFLLEEGTTNGIKKTLDEQYDYRIVSEGAWDLLYGWYGGGPPIKRRAITLPGGSVQVELHGLSLKVYRSSDMSGPPFEVVESKFATIQQLKTTLCSELGLGQNSVRIWDYFDWKPFALLEPDLDQSLESKRIMDGQPILLEEQLMDGSWPQLETDPQTTPQPAVASSISSGYLQSSADIPSVGEPIQRGVVGLQNLGNTCFMNSSVQCLSNIPHLREFFLDGTYKADLNRSAHKTEGKLAESFAELLEMMWRPNTTKVAPRNFKWQVGQFAEQFSGYGQQDSMELIEYVLDGLKEDCNQVTGPKPYIELKEADGRPDLEVAAEALHAYHARSMSRVDELFVGLFKSVVRCPDKECGRTSVTFDPFLSAKLSLSSSAEQRQMAVNLVVVRDCDSQCARGYQQVTVKVHKEASVKELIEAVAEEVGEGLKASNCILVEVWSRKVHKYYEEQESVETIHSQDNLLLSEVPDARPFCKSGEQRWGPMPSAQSADEEMDDQPSTSSSSCGAVLYHRKAGSSNLYSRARDIGVPLLITIPKDATARMLYKQVERNLHRLFDEKDVNHAEWKIWKVSDSKYQYHGDEQLLDSESDELLPQGKESTGRLHFAIEWQASEDADLPEKLLEDPFSKADNTDDGEVDLVRLLQMFVQEEKLSSEDAWYCNRCKEHKEAFKKLEFHHCPPVLVLQLKRFQYTRWSRERLNNPVSFPLENLDLSPYLTASARETSTVNPVYDLAAVSKHIGSLGGGHYVAFSRSSIDGEWYHFDDSSVRRCSEEDVASDKVGAYVLFYIRRDHRPEQFGSP